MFYPQVLHSLPAIKKADTLTTGITQATIITGMQEKKQVPMFQFRVDTIPLF
jgi:hypothetical protein